MKVNHKCLWETPTTISKGQKTCYFYHYIVEFVVKLMLAMNEDDALW